MTREDQRQALKQQGMRLKKEIKALADNLDKAGRLKLKIKLQVGGISETVARQMMDGTYGSLPRKDHIEVMEDVLASYGKAKAS